MSVRPPNPVPGGRAGARVLFIAIDAYSAFGGLQQFNRRVITALQALEQGGQIAQAVAQVLRDQPDPVPGTRGPAKGFAGRRAAFIAAVVQQARHSDILLLGHINLLPLGCLCRLANPRLRLGLFAHGVEVWGLPEYRRMRRWEPFLLRFVQRIAAVSRYTAGVMAQRFSVPEAKFAVLPNAVDPREAPGDDCRVAWSALVVSRMATHDTGKNIDAVIRAFAPLAAENAGARLHIVGDGVLRPSLERLAQDAGIADRVRFHGRVSDAELAEAYRQAAVFVLPSDKEGFGIVYLEAWQAGLPVICGAGGASGEVVTDGEDGFVVNAADIATLTARMRSLFADDALRLAMRDRGREKVRRLYLHESFVGNLGGFLAELRPTGGEGR